MKPIKLPPKLDVTSFHGSGKGYMLVDTRFFPIVFIQFRNDATEDLMHKYYAWRLEASKVAHDNGALHMIIKDLNEWGVPKPTVRRVIGEYAQRDSSEAGFGWRFLIVANSIMRGAMTAIAWIKGENTGYSFSKSFAAGIIAARQMCEQNDLEFVDGLDPETYVFPQAELEAATRR